MAERTSVERRQCPTRVDGVHSLIEQSITPRVCLDRQRGRYHKCFLCLYRGLPATATLPSLSAAPHVSTLVPLPPSKAQGQNGQPASRRK